MSFCFDGMVVPDARLRIVDRSNDRFGYYVIYVRAALYLVGVALRVVCSDKLGSRYPYFYFARIRVGVRSRANEP